MGGRGPGGYEGGGGALGACEYVSLGPSLVCVKACQRVRWRAATRPGIAAVVDPEF